MTCSPVFMKSLILLSLLVLSVFPSASPVLADEPETYPPLDKVLGKNKEEFEKLVNGIGKLSRDAAALDNEADLKETNASFNDPFFGNPEELRKQAIELRQQAVNKRKEAVPQIKKALAILREGLKSNGVDFSSVKDRTPVPDETGLLEQGKMGSTVPVPAGGESKIFIFPLAFATAASAYSTVMHERTHAIQWQDPETAQALGDNGREVQAYLRDLENSDSTGLSKPEQENLKMNLKSYLGKFEQELEALDDQEHFKDLDEEQQKKLRYKFNELKDKANKLVAAAELEPVTEEAFVGIIIKGHVRTAEGKPLADAIITLEGPKPTALDFLKGAIPGWDPQKDAAPPVFVKSGAAGGFAVTSTGKPGTVPASDTVVSYTVVILDTLASTDRHIAGFKHGGDTEKFIKDYTLRNTEYIPVPSDAAVGALMIYHLPDVTKAESPEEIIRKHPDVLYIEFDHCREFQPDIDKIKKRLSQIEKKKADLSRQRTVKEKERSEAKSESLRKMRQGEIDSIDEQLNGLGEEKTELESELRQLAEEPAKLTEAAGSLRVGDGCDEATMPAPSPLLKEEPKRKPQKWAVVVGIENEKLNDGRSNPSGKGDPTNAAVHDAVEFEDILQLWGFNDIKLFTDKYDETGQQDKQATKKNILDVLNNFTPNVDQGDLVVFYFSGHGNGANVLHPTEKPERKAGYLLIRDDVIWDTDLRDALVPIAEKGAKLIVVIDTSFGNKMSDFLDPKPKVAIKTTMALSPQHWKSHTVKLVDRQETHKHHPLTFNLLSTLNTIPKEEMTGGDFLGALSRLRIKER